MDDAGNLGSNASLSARILSRSSRGLLQFQTWIFSNAARMKAPGGTRSTSITSTLRITEPTGNEQAASAVHHASLPFKGSPIIAGITVDSRSHERVIKEQLTKTVDLWVVWATLVEARRLQTSADGPEDVCYCL
jgi:hypothetical protein